jgi:hypothetical protein
VSEAGEEGEQGVGGAIAAGLDVAWSCPVECFLFDGHVAVEVMRSVVLDCSWPSHSAITEVSQPAASRDMAQVCLRACGVGRLAFSDGQCWAAVAACLATRHPTALLVSRRARRVGNNGSSGAPPRSWIHARSRAAVGLDMGVHLCFRPLPRQRTWAPVPSCRSPMRRPVSSVIRPGIRGGSIPWK